MRLAQYVIAVCGTLTVVGMWLGVRANAGTPRIRGGTAVESTTEAITPPVPKEVTNAAGGASPLYPFGMNGGRSYSPGASSQNSTSEFEQAKQEYLQAKKAYDADQARYAAVRNMNDQLGGQMGAYGAMPMPVQEPDPYLYQQYQEAWARYRNLGGRPVR